MIIFLPDGKVTNGVLRGLNLGSLLLLTYINDLPKTKRNDAKVVPFADDTSITGTTSNQGEFKHFNQNTL
jgi:hypothetical protein